MLHWNQEQYRYFKGKVEEITRPLLDRIEALEAELKKPHSSPQQRIVYARGISDIDASVTSTDSERRPFCSCKASQREGRHMAWCQVSSTEDK